jgi:hypothetical protein
MAQNQVELGNLRAFGQKVCNQRTLVVAARRGDGALTEPTQRPLIVGFGNRSRLRTSNISTVLVEVTTYAWQVARSKVDGAQGCALIRPHGGSNPARSALLAFSKTFASSSAVRKACCPSGRRGAR